MAKLFLILGFILTITIIGTIKPGLAVQDLKNVGVEFVASDNITKFLGEYNVKEMPRQLLQQEFGGDVTFQYHHGNRMTNDFLVAQESQNHTWSVPHDVQIKLQYPKNGKGCIVTYAEIRVTQSSNIGRAYLVSGGSGHRNIGIVVEARNTVSFKYNAKIYGIN